MVGIVTLGDNSKGEILSKGCVGKTSSTIKNVYLVNSLKYNLLSIN